MENEWKNFVEYWKGRGDEKGESQPFWLNLIRLLGVADPEQFISFENRVSLSHTSFIDAYIPSTKVLIEQKKIDKDLRKPIKQSDGTFLTPFQQAKRYANEMKHSEHPRWIITSNFKSFLVYDMENPNGEPEEILLKYLGKESYRLHFLIDTGKAHIRKEMEVSVAAGKLVGLMYDALLSQYRNPNDPQTLKSLNVLIVRLVFCLYAEDADIFGRHAMFADYMRSFHPQHFRTALIALFKVLNTPIEERDPYIEENLTAFPYVNGGLFTDETIEIPQFTQETIDLILDSASDGFDWSDISPTIFGAVFESTLNPETRRSGGMHYTSIENIHKVIDPLFLDELKDEFDTICTVQQPKVRERKLLAFQDKLAGLKFLDPACGSGNFLTETYISLRLLENDILKQILGEQIVIGEFNNPIKVSISQFYGIEINDFAITVAKTALWIAESQMIKATEGIVNMHIDFLPLKTNAFLHEGNSLQVDWENIVCKEELSYIMGNPPFIGYSLQTKGQKTDMLSIYVDENGKQYKTAGKIDYVAGWYFKASDLMQGTKIQTAFVSTNSITQGEQVAGVWKPLYERFGIAINFAWRTFKWNSESSDQAAVHCVIVGFSSTNKKNKKIYFNGKNGKWANNISPYLLDTDNIFIEGARMALCEVPEMTTGNRPADGGHLIIEAGDYDDFIKKEPMAKQYIKKLLGSKEFINQLPRYCLWLVDVSPSELKKMPLVLERIRLCKKDRENSPDAGRKKLAETSALFRELQNPSSYIAVPKVSSENRRYIPMGFLDINTIASDLLFIIPNATIYHFGILMSNVHMAWMRTVSGRLKSDYRYSRDIVYNNFPWPMPTGVQQAKIEKAAQAILDARSLYPDSNLAELYNEVLMPPVLRKAHQANDRAVMEAYGFWGKLNSESECVAELMKMYQKLVVIK